MNAADLVAAYRRAFLAIAERAGNAVESGDPDNYDGELETIQELAEEALALEVPR